MCTAVDGGSIPRPATRSSVANDQTSATPMASHRTKDRRKPLRRGVLGVVSGFSITSQNNSRAGFRLMAWESSDRGLPDRTLRALAIVAGGTFLVPALSEEKSRFRAAAHSLIAGRQVWDRHLEFSLPMGYAAVIASAISKARWYGSNAGGLRRLESGKSAKDGLVLGRRRSARAAAHPLRIARGVFPGAPGLLRALEIFLRNILRASQSRWSRSALACITRQAIPTAATARTQQLSFPLTSRQVVTIKVHHLVPRSREVLHKRLLRVVTGIDLGDCPELGVRTEHQVDTGCGPLRFARRTIAPLIYAFG